MLRPISILAVYVLFLFGQIGFCACTVSTSGLSFVEYNPLSPNHADYTGTIQVHCDRNSRVQVSIGPSLNSGFNPRTMKHPAFGDTLMYNIYTNPQRTYIWGDGTQGTQVVSVNVKKNSSAIVTAYGRVFANQDVGTGAYLDTLTVTISY